MKRSYLFLFFLLFMNVVRAEERVIINLWPGAVPGETEAKAPPVISENKGGNVTRIKKVTNPTLEVYEPKTETRNGAAVIMCPGGGYSILAVDLEGYEVAEWLNELGYTAFVLQYRVPQKQMGALQDAQRAIRYVRGNAKKWNVDAAKIGVVGFSAGGSLSARISTRYNEKLYTPIDKLDHVSARPDFSVLIYPAYLDQGKKKTLTPELKVDAKTPPMFLFVAGDDRFTNSSLVMSSELKKRSVPFELHVTPKGGHGFGIRAGNPAAVKLKSLCAEWLNRTVLKQTAAPEKKVK